ncbi:hypothetical protein ACFW40_21265 [Streptomyces sp. NPDC058807]|uniref:hypothetical protein n=1 Tax=unclassified Streptomyces TaxID=2593676 RepID=UPI00367B4F5B
MRLAQEEVRRAGRTDGGTVRDLRQPTGIHEQEARLALRADRARNPLSADEPRGTTTGSSWSPTRWRSGRRRAAARERTILKLYFGDCPTQRQVADAAGIPRCTCPG